MKSAETALVPPPDPPRGASGDGRRMDIFPGAPLPLALAVLALVDSLSIGTLLVPIFFLVAPGKVRGGRMMLYLVTIAVFYLLVGVLFLLGLINVVDIASGFFASTPGMIIRLVAGAALLAVAIFGTGAESSRKKTVARAGKPNAARTTDDPAAAQVEAESAPPGRLVRWREKLLSARTAPTAIMGVALAAGLVEVATMLPYIVGMTMLADSGIAFPLQIAALGGYCALMIAPAVLLLVLRIVAARVVERPLQRLAGWLQRTAAENTLWILGIVGFLIARSAAQELGVFDWLGSIGTS